ncbi:hypothetical protein NE237_013505 [Protea cynaroides]|uniref:Multidrug resistance protein ABC transporter family protein n=1 Tax=Protea cynaroides TaxID=273540 RepID=A0A9Q0GYR6_9MAGN|nr:hypothetical protein NE237_013505 [Protea cynaroides]
MGNHIPRRRSDNSGKVKVIMHDGTVHEFDQPLAVAELMLEHPQQAVVEFPSVMAGNRAVPLPADKKLESQKIYLMLPMKGGKVAALSADGARHILSKAKSLLRSQFFLSSAKILPLFARIFPSGIRMEGNVIVSHGQDFSQLEKPEMGNKLGTLLEALEERPEFLSKQFSGKGWKPTLDTIKEKAMEKKVPHWLFQ